MWAESDLPTGRRLTKKNDVGVVDSMTNYCLVFSSLWKRKQ